MLKRLMHGISAWLSKIKHPLNLRLKGCFRLIQQLLMAYQIRDNVAYYS